ncbi:MAG: FAD-dependent oxidoreductase, partial [Verrucomicrobiae bacterium]|nr:FAD-dependent oxidoreductase [Verrucomicrobiae bacterium]
MKRLLTFFLLATFAITPSIWAVESAEVIVYGATPGGFCAAIAAAREGASVILLEPTGHIGGVNTGGLSFSDSNQTVRSTVMGLFDEWHRRVEKDYQDRGVTLPYQVSVKDNSVWTYEPHVAARVTQAMLAEAGVRVLPKHPLKAVIKDGPRITRLDTPQSAFTARIFVDATYEGDLLAAAGVSWTIGRESRAAFGESLAGKRYPKPKMDIAGRDADGGLLPLITTGDAGPEEEGDRNVMVYSFRLCLTKDPKNRVPFPEPTRYDPDRFEVIRRYYQQEKRPILLWDLYELPNGKFDANNGIGKQFSMGLVGACNGWSEADEAGRAEIWEAHKQYTLELYRFLTTDPSVPEHLRKQLAELGLCRDEFPDSGHWSPQLYVREGRRMRGLFVLSQKDILEEPTKEDPVVVASFPIDSHDCQRVALPEGGVINEGTIFPVRMDRRKHGYPYQVPYRSLLPRPEECDNLLVPVALSSTHVALSSIRVEPTWMILGQSAGIAAALAARENVSVQQLRYPELRERLLAQGQVLELPVLPELPPDPKGAVSLDPASLPGIVLDDAAAELKGPWSSSTNFKPHVGTGYLHDDRRGDGESAAVFRFTVPKSGRYELRLAYSAHETRATNVPITVENDSVRHEFVFD